MIGVAEEIADLFLARFDPSIITMSDAAFAEKCQELAAKISVLQFDAAKVLLQKMVEGNEWLTSIQIITEGRRSGPVGAADELLLRGPLCIELAGEAEHHGLVLDRRGDALWSILHPRPQLQCLPLPVLD